MSDALQACPFCGGDAPETCEQEGRHYVVCYGCALESPFQDSRAEAVAAWNRRAAIAAPPGWVLVPVEPTETMLYPSEPPGTQLGDLAAECGRQIWARMLAAAPDAQKGAA